MQHDQSDFHLLLHAAALLEAELRRRLAGLGVLPRQALALSALARMGPVTQVVMAREFGITAAAVSTMVSRLLAAGYVARSPHPREERSHLVSLTASGRRLVADIEGVWAGMDAVIARHLGRSGADEIARIAALLRARLGEPAPAMRPLAEQG